MFHCEKILSTQHYIKYVGKYKQKTQKKKEEKTKNKIKNLTRFSFEQFSILAQENFHHITENIPFLPLVADLPGKGSLFLANENMYVHLHGTPFQDEGLPNTRLISTLYKSIAISVII